VTPHTLLTGTGYPCYPTLGEGRSSVRCSRNAGRAGRAGPGAMAMGADTVAMVEATPVGKLCLLMA
jgi:hypothetical protein